MGKFVGLYHNRLDKKYFHKSVYIRKWEEAFNVKIKDYPLQYELVFETFNTLIKLNNILFTTNYLPKETKVDKILDLLNGYLNTYKNKINKYYLSTLTVILNYGKIYTRWLFYLYKFGGKKYVNFNNFINRG